MSTTRHLINRQRRLAASANANANANANAHVGATATRSPAGVATRPRPRPRPSEAAVQAEPVADRPRPGSGPRPRVSRLPRPGRLGTLIALLAVLTVLLGGFAAWAANKASGLHDSVATGNTALTDNARTSELKGTIAQDVNAVFSYDYADTARTDTAAQHVLTGKAVQQYATMLAQVRAQAPTQKLVLTTTVTDTGVELIDGDRARVLVFADQRNTSTAKTAGTTYAAAMFAVDAVRQGAGWKIASIDTFS